MARRTKLIIAALFLVLFGIAITGLAFYYHPESPLRFSLAAVQDRGSGNAGNVTEVPAPYYVLVENVSHAPVIFHNAILDEASPMIVRRSYPMAGISANLPFDSDPTVNGTHWLIPPRGSIRCAVVPIEEDGLAAARRGHMMVEYLWRTPLSHRYLQFHDWICSITPRQIPAFLQVPESFRDSTLLEVPPADSSH